MMNRFLSVLALGIACSAAPVFAKASDPIRFTRDGTTYVFTTRVTDSGARVLRGYEQDTGRSFNLRVSRGRVTGEYGGDTVSYPVPQLAPRTAVSD